MTAMVVTVVAVVTAAIPARAVITLAAVVTAAIPARAVITLAAAVRRVRVLREPAQKALVLKVPEATAAM